MGYGLLALAIAPGVFLVIYFYLLDKYEPEPIKKIIITFFLGFLAAFVAIIIELILEDILLNSVSGLLLHLLKAFVVAGFVEEFSKYLMVISGPYKSRHFNEIMDGIIYTVVVSLGFATLENIFYVLKGGFSVGILRAFLSVPAHAFFSSIMGFFIGKAKFTRSKTKRNFYFIIALFIASLFHGLYDFILFIKLLYGLAIIPLLIILYFILKKQVLIAQIDSFKRNRF